MNPLFVILAIVGIVVLYILYGFFFPPKSRVTSKNYLAKTVPDVLFEKLENPSSMKYSIEVWIFANDLSIAKEDISKSGGKTNNSGGCIFDVPDIYSLNLFKDSSLAFYNNGTYNQPAFVLPGFPLQRWVYVVISVDNSLVDMYLDGKLIKSLKTKYTGKVPDMTSKFTFGTGDIYIAGLNRIANSTDSNTVFKNYMQGNAGLAVPGFNVSLDFLKNSKISKNIQIM